MTTVHVPTPRWKHAALVAYLLMVTVAIIAVGKETNDVQDRVVRVEQQSPCGRFGPDSQECSASLTRIVKNLSASQACVIVESAGYSCRAEREGRPTPQGRDGAPGGSSGSPSDPPLAPGSTPGAGASGAPTPSPSSPPVEGPPAPPPTDPPAEPGGPGQPPSPPGPPASQEGPLVQVDGAPVVPCVSVGQLASVNC